MVSNQQTTLLSIIKETALQDASNFSAAAVKSVDKSHRGLDHGSSLLGVLGMKKQKDLEPEALNNNRLKRSNISLLLNGQNSYWRGNVVLSWILLIFFYR